MHSFDCVLNDTNRDIYANIHLKTARHLQESEEHLCARLLALCHAYAEDLVFENIDKEYESPELVRRNLSSDIEICCFIGCPESKILRRTLRSAVQDARIAVYFYERSQVERFLHYLRGSKSNWIKEIAFFYIDNQKLLTLSQSLTRRINWELTLSDEELYLTSANTQYIMSIHELDMWGEFQNYLRESAEA